MLSQLIIQIRSAKSVDQPVESDVGACRPLLSFERGPAEESLGSAGAAIKIFFLGCVVIAGVFGAATVGRRILFIQALPAAAGLLFVIFT